MNEFVLSAKDNKALQQPGFQYIIEKFTKEKY